MGLFEPSEIEPLTLSLSRDGLPRLIKLKREKLEPLLNAFDPGLVSASIEAFSAHLQKHVGTASAAPQRSSLLQGVLTLLSDLKKVVAAAGKDGNSLGARQLTEAEALTDGTLDRLRRSLQGPRIILTG